MNYYNDNDPFCCAVLRERMADGLIPEGVIDDRDFRTIDYQELGQYRQVHLFAGIGGFALAARMAGWPDDRELWTAGFPCQPVSVAGKRLAQEDERWLWPWLARALCTVRPRLVMLENVPGLFHSGFGDVLGDLAEGGFDAEWGVVSAAAVGAPHLRERVWILAYPTDRGLERRTRCKGKDTGTVGRWNANGSRSNQDGDSQDGSPADVADTDSGRRQQRDATKRGLSEPYAACDVGNPECQRQQRQGQLINSSNQAPNGKGQANHAVHVSLRQQWTVEPDVGRVAHGVSARVDRLRSLGNSIVPQVAAQILKGNHDMKLYPPWGPCHCGQGYSFPDVRQEGRVYRLWWKCMSGHFRYQVIDLEEGT